MSVTGYLCCSVLQCVAACCSVLQRVAVCCRSLSNAVHCVTDANNSIPILLESIYISKQHKLQCGFTMPLTRPGVWLHCVTHTACTSEPALCHSHGLHLRHSLSQCASRLQRRFIVSQKHRGFTDSLIQQAHYVCTALLCMHCLATATRCNTLQHIATHIMYALPCCACTVLLCIHMILCSACCSVCCSVLQYLAVCGSML